jgi:hypothetical protein
MISPTLFGRLLDSRPGRRLADKYFRGYARRRLFELDHLDVAACQERLLLKLVRAAQHTQFGARHDFARIRSRGDYLRLVPLRNYEDFWRDYWQPQFPRLAGVTWPQANPFYALSSGTTSGSTKYLPVSPALLLSNRKAALTLLAAHVALSPKAQLFSGQMFFLGGSTDLTKLDDGSRMGDLSAIANITVPTWLRPFTFPPADVALLKDWDVKLDRLAELSVTRRITLFGGVPSWMLILIDRLKQRTGKRALAEIWPHLELIVHGGVKFDPYRELFAQAVGSPRVRFMESYPASEAFIAFEDPRRQRLRVIPDHDIYFEFVPVAELESAKPIRHALAEVELDLNYAVVLTTCAGLWSYVIGDTVAFESRDPPLLRFTGRTKYYLSAFGEHLISEEIEKAIAAAARAAGTMVLDFHVGPVFPAGAPAIGHHLYLVECAPALENAEVFVHTLDTVLGELNEDYQAHRRGDTSLQRPRLGLVKAGGFTAWMRAHGKLGGQHKLPRMDNTGRQTAEMAQWLERNGWLT